MRISAALLLPVLCLAASCARSALPSPPSGAMCRASEVTYFSCGTHAHKQISLCGTVSAGVQYRFGTAARLELQVPDAPRQDGSPLKYAHYARFQTDRSEVTFSHEQTDYAVFDYHEDGQRHAGVHITLADGKELEIACDGAVQGQLAPLGKILACDSDNALNGGRCP